MMWWCDGMMVWWHDVSKKTPTDSLKQTPDHQLPVCEGNSFIVFWGTWALFQGSGVCWNFLRMILFYTQYILHYIWWENRKIRYGFSRNSGCSYVTSKGIYLAFFVRHQVMSSKKYQESESWEFWMVVRPKHSRPQFIKRNWTDLVTKCY